jgi:hypothetical protein
MTRELLQEIAADARFHNERRELRRALGIAVFVILLILAIIGQAHAAPRLTKAQAVENWIGCVVGQAAARHYAARPRARPCRHDHDLD